METWLVPDPGGAGLGGTGGPEPRHLEFTSCWGPRYSTSLPLGCATEPSPPPFLPHMPGPGAGLPTCSSHHPRAQGSLSGLRHWRLCGKLVEALSSPVGVGQALGTEGHRSVLGTRVTLSSIVHLVSALPVTHLPAHPPCAPLPTGSSLRAASDDGGLGLGRASSCSSPQAGVHGGRCPGPRPFLEVPGEDSPGGRGTGAVLGCQTTGQSVACRGGKGPGEGQGETERELQGQRQRETEMVALGRRLCDGDRVLPCSSSSSESGQAARSPLARPHGAIRRTDRGKHGRLGSLGTILLLGAFFPHQIILGSVQGPVPKPWGDQHSLTRCPEACKGSARGRSHSLSQPRGQPPS